MVRSYLTLLLLLNYLLVVGTGAMGPARMIEQPFPYVHSQDCQLLHTLRVACFDDCNGVQYTAKRQAERFPLTHLLTSLKGLDLHHLPEHCQLVFTMPLATRLTTRPSMYEAIAPRGYRDRIEQPPRRG